MKRSVTFGGISGTITADQSGRVKDLCAAYYQPEVNGFPCTLLPHTVLPALVFMIPPESLTSSTAKMLKIQTDL